MSAMLLALGLALGIQGATTCPTPGEVSQHLARLVPETSNSGPASRAILSAGPGFVTIELLGPDGGLLAERRLEAAPCAEMAEAVAVILAAWQAQFSPQVSPTAIEPARPEPAARAAPASPAKTPVRFDVGMGALTSLAGGQLAYGGKLEAILIPWAHGLGLHGALSLASQHTQSIATPPTKAVWLRPALALGPNLRLQGDTLALDVHGDAVLGLLHVKGSGLSQTASDTTMQLGLGAGLRGLWTWNNGAVWLGADLFGFPGQDNLTVGNHGQVGRLPHVEIQFSLGLALGRFR